MARSRKILTAGAVSVAALALIGAGAGATFTDATASQQDVQAGTINMVLNANRATYGQGTKTLGLPTVGPTNSTFKSDVDLITMTNTGTVRADAIFLGIKSTATTAADLALQSQLSVCIFSGTATVWNGKVSTLQALGDGQQIQGPFVPNTPDTYSAEFYAGTNTTQCKNDAVINNSVVANAYPTPLSLDDPAQGGLVGMSVTVKYVG